MMVHRQGPRCYYFSQFFHDLCVCVCLPIDTAPFCIPKRYKKGARGVVMEEALRSRASIQNVKEDAPRNKKRNDSIYISILRE